MTRRALQARRDHLMDRAQILVKRLVFLRQNRETVDLFSLYRFAGSRAHLAAVQFMRGRGRGRWRSTEQSSARKGSLGGGGGGSIYPSIHPSIHPTLRRRVELGGSGKPNPFARYSNHEHLLLSPLISRACSLSFALALFPLTDVPLDLVCTSRLIVFFLSLSFSWHLGRHAGSLRSLMRSSLARRLSRKMARERRP